MKKASFLVAVALLALISGGALLAHKANRRGAIREAIRSEGKAVERTELIDHQKASADRAIEKYKGVITPFVKDELLLSDDIKIDEHSPTTVEVTVGPKWDEMSGNHKEQLISKLWFNWDELCPCKGSQRGWVKFIEHSGEVIGMAGDNSGKFLVLD